MASIIDNNRTDNLDNQYCKLVGATDNSDIGNNLDRLKVDSKISSLNASQLNYVDMNASNGGVARSSNIGTTFTNIYSYTGSGEFLGFLSTVEGAGNETWFYRMVIDGVNYPFFGTTGLLTGDLNGIGTYDLADSSLAGRATLGISRHDNSLRFESTQGIKFNTSFQLQARNSVGNRVWRSGFVKILKES